MRRYMMDRYYHRKNEALRALGERCVNCGSTEGLQFDHADPKKKAFSLWSRTTSKEKFLKELKKCQLLCRECHIKKTIEERGQKPARGTHGTLSAYPRCGPPKCNECRRAKREWFREWRKKKGVKPRISPDHGSDAMYQRGCKCDLCRRGHAEYQREGDRRRARQRKKI